MAQKLSPEKIRRIQKLAKQGYTTAEIVKAEGMSESSVYRYVRLPERDFDSKGYDYWCAREKGYDSRHERVKDGLARRRYPTYTAYKSHLIRNRGFKTFQEYYEHTAKQNGTTFRERRDEWARKRGFKSRVEYEAYLAEERRKRPENIAFSELVRERMEKFGVSQGGLARAMRVRRETVQKYASGYSIPKGRNLNLLCEILEIEDLPGDED